MIPAVLLCEVIESIGPEKVWAAELGPILVTIWVIVLVVEWGSPSRPIRPTSAISAGNSASSP